MVPEAVVFDLGKVLLDFDYGRAAVRLTKRSKASPEEVRAFIDQSSLLYRYETGSMTTEEFFEEVRQASQFTGDFEEFASIFGDIFTPINAMIGLNDRLREAEVPTFIFSNTNDLAITHIRRTYPFFSRFTDYVLSYEHQAMKPDARIYEAVERVTGKSGGALLYIDDRAENIATARQRGWHAVLHETAAATIQAVAAAGLPG